MSGLLFYVIEVNAGPDDPTRWAMVLLVALGLFAVAFLLGFVLGEQRK